MTRCVRLSHWIPWAPLPSSFSFWLPDAGPQPGGKCDLNYPHRGTGGVRKTRRNHWSRACGRRGAGGQLTLFEMVPDGANMQVLVPIDFFRALHAGFQSGFVSGLGAVALWWVTTREQRDEMCWDEWPGYFQVAPVPGISEKGKGIAGYSALTARRRSSTHAHSILEIPVPFLPAPSLHRGRRFGSGVPSDTAQFRLKTSSALCIRWRQRFARSCLVFLGLLWPFSLPSCNFFSSCTI